MIKYNKHFIVKGSGEDNISNINAFDIALMEAGISEVNLVPVSSILSEGSEELEIDTVSPLSFEASRSNRFSKSFFGRQSAKRGM